MSVAELNAGIGAVLSSAFPDEVWVRGEIANLNRPPSGHVYFDLVGDGCALAVTLWASDKQVVNAVLRRAGGAVRMTDGTEVRIRVARVVVRASAAGCRCACCRSTPRTRSGRWPRHASCCCARLQAEGLLRRQASLTLPPVPLRVGLITSDGSAAAHDFLRTLEGKRSGVARHAARRPRAGPDRRAHPSSPRSTPPARADAAVRRRCASCGAAAREPTSRPSTARRSRGPSRSHLSPCGPASATRSTPPSPTRSRTGSSGRRPRARWRSSSRSHDGATSSTAPGTPIARAASHHLRAREAARRRLRGDWLTPPRVVRSTAPAG